MSIKTELKDKGFVKFDSKSGQEIESIAKTIGTICRFNEVNVVQNLIPKSKESSTKNTYSGNYGFSAFPFHSDLAHWYFPPRYFLLKCVIPSTDVSTRILKSEDVFKGIPRNDLERALFKPRKKLTAISCLLKLHQNDVYRWDEIFLSPANNLGLQVREKVLEKINLIPVKEIVLDAVSQNILIDNWRVIHGRSAITKNSIKRRVERIYLSEVRG